MKFIKFRKRTAKNAVSKVAARIAIKKAIFWTIEWLTGIDPLEWIIDFFKDLFDDWV